MKSGTYSNKKYGFKFKAPEKWAHVPVDIDEKWIVAKFISPKTYMPKRSEYYIEHHPQIRVIAFHDEMVKRKKAKIEKSKNGSRLDLGERPFKG